MEYKVSVSLTVPQQDLLKFPNTVFRAKVQTLKVANRSVIRLNHLIADKPKAGDIILANGKALKILATNRTSNEPAGFYLEIDTAQANGLSFAFVVNAVAAAYGWPYGQFIGGDSTNSTPSEASRQPIEATPIDFAWNVKAIGDNALKIALAIGIIYLLVKTNILQETIKTLKDVVK